MNGVTSRSRIMSSFHSENMIGSLLVHSWWMSQWLMRHDRCGRTTQYTNGTLTHRVPSTGPIVFLSITVSTSGRVYEDFTRLLFLHSHREDSILSGELPEESEQFPISWASRLSNLKGSVGLILVKTSVMWVTIPIDLSTSPFIPLPHFLNSRRVSPLLKQSLVLIPHNSLPKRHMMCVMFKSLVSYCAS
jgi:hypothetical protein